MKDIKNHSKEPNRLYISKGKVPELDDFGNKEIQIDDNKSIVQQIYMYNQQKSQQPLNKPTILIVLFIFVIIQVCLIIALLILQSVMGYIGFTNASTKIQLASTCNTYQISKYGIFLQYPMSIAFVFVCVACLFAIIMVISVVKTTVAKYLSQQLLPGFSQNDEMAALSLIYIYISGVITRVWYIIQSLIVIMVAVIFGYFLSYYIEIVAKSTCTYIYISTQILTITIVAGVALLVSLACWIIIMIITSKLQKMEQQLLKRQPYKDPLKYSFKKSDTESSSKKSQKQQIQMKKISSKDIESQNSDRKFHPVFIANNTREPFLEKDSRRSDHKQSSRVKRNYHQQNPDNFRKSIVRDSSTYQARKDIYETPYRNINKPFYDSPRQNEHNSGLVLHRRSRVNTNTREKFKQEEHQQIKKYQKRILPSEGGIYEGNRNRLHSTYFKDEDGARKSRYNDKKSGKGGILSRYIYGEYVQ